MKISREGICRNTGRTWIKKGQHLSFTTEFKKGELSAFAGRKHTEESKEKSRQSHLGMVHQGTIEATKKRIGKLHPRWSRFEKECEICKEKFLTIPSYSHKRFCGRECNNKFLSNMAKERKGKPFLALRGENNPNWKGGFALKDNRKRHKIMGQIEYKNWRRSVFERDSYRCFDCGENGYLEAHHIIPYKIDSSKIYDIKNGITLCRPCHQLTMGKELELADMYYTFTQAQV